MQPTTVNVIEAEDNTVAASCGPIGPPIPGYVPGSIVIDQEIVAPEGGEIEDDVQRETEPVRHFLDEASDEDDDLTSGIFARLKSTAGKYGSPCGIP